MHIEGGVNWLFFLKIFLKIGTIEPAHFMLMQNSSPSELKTTISFLPQKKSFMKINTFRNIDV